MEAIVERSGNVESYGAMVQTDWPINGWNTQHDQNLWSRTCILSWNQTGNTQKKTPFHGKNQAPWFLKKKRLLISWRLSGCQNGGVSNFNGFLSVHFRLFQVYLTVLKCHWCWSSYAEVVSCRRCSLFTVFFLANGPSGKPWKWGTPSSKRSFQWRFQMVWLEDVALCKIHIT